MVVGVTGGGQVRGVVQVQVGEVVQVGVFRSGGFSGEGSKGTNVRGIEGSKGGKLGGGGGGGRWS